MSKEIEFQFKKGRLRLIQPDAGNAPDTGSSEQWLIVELTTDDKIENYLNEKLIYEWLGAGFTTWGNYSVRANHTRNDADPSFYIGVGEPGKYPKIWRYNPGQLSIEFGTIEANTYGGGSGYGEKWTDLKPDLTLYNAVLFGKKITPDGSRQFGNGFVKRASWRAPFRKGTVFWKPNDIYVE